MSEITQPPRIGFLGTGPEEIQLLLELRAGEGVELVGVYDANPSSPGLAMAELVGVLAGSDPPALERLRAAEFIVLPQDRYSAQDAVRWVAGLRAELLPLADARRRWAALRAVRTERVDSSAAERTLSEAVDASARLQDRADLADWILNVAMRTVGANGGSIQLLVPETSELYLLAARGLSQRLVRFGRHRVGEGISGTVAATGAPQMLHGPRTGLPPRERGEIQASMSVPLEEVGELLGVLNVSSTVRGKRFGEEHLRALERLTPRMARLLRDAAELEPGTPQLDVPRLLRRTESAGVDLPGRLRALCEHARETLGAESVELYLATEDGDWLRVHGPSPTGQEILTVTRRAELDAAFAERRWVHSTEAGSETGEDAVEAAIDRALEPGVAHRSHLACPLEGIEQVGVLVLEFTSLDAADHCVRAGTVAVGQLAFGLDALLREYRQNRRLQGYAVLARSLQRLVDVQGTAAFDATLTSEAAKLTAARTASVRRVDEAARVFSRPVTFGVPPESIESWRALDARVTERTLLTRRAVVTTAIDETEEETAPEPLHLSHLSVPFEHEGQIVAVLNVYEKQPRDELEAQVFSCGDRELLETLSLVASRMVARAATPELESAPSQPGGGPGAEEPPEFEPSAGRRGAPGGTLVQVIESALENAAAAQHGVGVWVLHFIGLARLGAGEVEARRRLAETVHLGLRSEDVVEWTGEEDLTIVGIGLPPGSRRLEARLAELVRPQLARLSRSLDTGIELRIGSSTFPQDGYEAEALLAAAIDRAR